MKRLESANLSAPRFVDVGGGQGAQCVAFINATKGSHPGKVILQDLPKTLDMAPKHEGVEKMHENFFEGQAIKSESMRVSDIWGTRRLSIPQAPHSTIFAMSCMITPTTGVYRF